MPRHTRTQRYMPTPKGPTGGNDWWNAGTQYIPEGVDWWNWRGPDEDIESLRKRKYQDINQNPYERGTVEYEAWLANLKEWEKKRDDYFGVSKEALQSPASYWNDDIKGWFSDGDWQEKILGDYSSKAQKEIRDKRKLMAEYGLAHGLYTQEDWENSEIKDDEIRRIWQENKDIENNKPYLYDMLKGMRDHDFKIRNVNGDRWDEYQRRRAIKRGIPPEEGYGGNAGVLDSPPEADPLNGQSNQISTDIPSFPGMDPVRGLTPTKGIDPFKPLNIKDTIYGNNGLPKLDSTATQDNIGTTNLPTKSSQMVEKAWAKDDIGSAFGDQLLGELLQNSLDISYDTSLNQISYALKKGMTYDDIRNNIYNKAEKIIDEYVDKYVDSKNLSKEQEENIRENLETQLRGNGWNNVDDWVEGLLFPGNYAEAPRELKGLVASLRGTIDNLDVLESKAMFKMKDDTGKTNVEIPKWINGKDLELSFRRGISPTIVDAPINALTDNGDFSIVSVAGSLNEVAKPGTGLFSALGLLTNPRKIWSKEYTDSEAMDAVMNIYSRQNKVDKAQAYKDIQSAYKDINKERDTWGYTTAQTLNAMAELGGMLVPYGGFAKASGNLLSRANFVERMVAKNPVSKLAPFEGRMLKFQRFLEGSNKIGGKAVPYFDEIFGFLPKNVAQNTMASFATQMFWHGADPDEAAESAKNMFVLEMFNQAFALAGVRGYKIFKAFGKGMGKLDKTLSGVERSMLYNKRLNAIHALSSFPAQGIATLIQNPDADTKQFASEMLMNLMMTGNNIVSNKRLARELKDYHETIGKDIREANNWASKSPDRNVETIAVKDLKARVEAGEANNEKIIPIAEDINPETKENEVIAVTGKNKSLYDFVNDKVESEKPVVNDYQDIIKANIPEEQHHLIDKILSHAGNIEIREGSDESDRPAWYDADQKAIYINNNVSDSYSDDVVGRIMLHEGAHAMSIDAYKGDESFRNEIEDLRQGLTETDGYKALMEKLSESKDESDKKIRSYIEYGMADGSETISMLFDPDMRDAVNELNKIKYKEKESDEPQGIKKKFWNKIKKVLRRGEGEEADESEGYISDLERAVMGYDYGETKTVQAEEPKEVEVEGGFKKSFEEDALRDELLGDIDAPAEKFIEQEKKEAKAKAKEQATKEEATEETVTEPETSRYDNLVNNLTDETDLWGGSILFEDNPKTESDPIDKKYIQFESSKIVKPEPKKKAKPKAKGEGKPKEETPPEDNQFFFMPKLTGDEMESLYNRVREGSGLPAMKSEDIKAKFIAKHGRKPIKEEYPSFVRDLGSELVNSSGKARGDYIGQMVDEMDLLVEAKEGDAVKFSPQHLNYAQRETMVGMEGGKPYTELNERIETLFKEKNNTAHVIDTPEMRQEWKEVSAVASNKLAQERLVPANVLAVDNGRTLGVNKVFGNKLTQTKMVDRTLPVSHSMNRFRDVNIASLIDQNGEFIPYATERVKRMFEAINPDNVEKVVGTRDVRTDTNGDFTSLEANKQTASVLLRQDQFLLPVGSKEASLIRMKGIKDLLNNKEKTIEYLRDLERYSFFRYLDSDNQWIGNSADVFKGRDLVKYANKLDFDKLIDKYINKKKIPIKDLFLEEPTDVTKFKQDIDAIGALLRKYYMQADKSVVAPAYLEEINKPKDENTTKQMADLMVDKLTDLLTWGLDTGGGNRTISFDGAFIKAGKTPWKYKNHLFSFEPNIIHNDYAKTFLDHLTKEDGEWDMDKLKESGLHISERGNLAHKIAVINTEYFADNELLHSYFAGKAQDGATQTLNSKAYDNIVRLMGKDPSQIGVVKPKLYDVDDNGSMFIYKTATYKRDNPDQYSKKYHKEFNELLDRMSTVAPFLTFETSVKGSSDFRLREENVSSIEDPNAIALFNQQGSLVDVVRETEGAYKSDPKLFEQELAYIKENLAKGIIDPRLVREIELVGDRAVSLIGTSHPVNTSVSGALGVNQVPMATRLNPLFDIDGGKGWKAIQHLENNAIANSMKYIEGAFAIRNVVQTLSTGGELTYTDSQLASAGTVIKDIVNELKARKEDNPYDTPGMSNRDVVELLETTVDGEGKLIPQKALNLLLTGNMFVNTMKGTAPAEQTFLQNRLKEKMSDALLTRSVGSALTLMPDMDSRASVARLYEPEIEALRKAGEDAKADDLEAQYKKIVAESIDEKTGNLKDYSLGVVLGKDVIKKFGLKAGDRVFLNLRPADDLHTLTPAVVAGVHDKPGTMTFNKAFLTEVLSRDFDKDDMQLVVQDDRFLSKEDFNNLYDLFVEGGMHEGRFKKNAGLYQEKEKELIGGQFSGALGNKFSYIDPTKTPQSRDIYNKIQTTNEDIGSMISRRNIITSAIRNLEWTRKDNDTYATVVDVSIGKKNYKVELNLRTGSEQSTIDFSDRLNYIITKMVDRSDFSSIDPMKAIVDEFVEKVGNKEYSTIDEADKEKVRNALISTLKGIGGYDAQRNKRANSLLDVTKTIEKVNKTPNAINGESVGSKTVRALSSEYLNVNNVPELKRYLLFNDFANSLRKGAVSFKNELIRKYPQHKQVFELLFGHNPNRPNVATELSTFFEKYTNMYKLASALEDDPRIERADPFPAISDNFGTFNYEKPSWKDVVAGTVLKDIFEENPHKVSKNLILASGNTLTPVVYSSTADGMGKFSEAVRTPDGKIATDENGAVVLTGKEVALTDIFGNDGKLTEKAKWLPAEFIKSKDFRTDWINRKMTVSDNTKAVLIGKTIANLSKVLGDNFDIDPNELFIPLAYNRNNNIAGSKDVNYVERGERASKAQAENLYDWFYGKPKKGEKKDPKKVEKTIEMVKNEARHDILQLVRGAKEAGLSPTINGKEIIDVLSARATKMAEKVIGKRKAEDQTKFFMPFLSSGLRFDNPKTFLKDLESKYEKVLGKRLNLVNLKGADYEELYNKVLKPELGKLFKGKNKDEALMSFLDTYAPTGMIPYIDRLKEGMTSEADNLRGQTLYVAEMINLAKNLKKQFTKVKDTKGKFSNPFSSRTPTSLLNDYTNPDNKRVYSADEDMLTVVGSTNGKITKDINGNMVTKPTRVGDMIDEATNTSVGTALLPQSQVDYVEPMKVIGDMADLNGIDIDEYNGVNGIGEETLGNNSKISSTMGVILNSPEVGKEIEDVHTNSSFNGRTRENETTVNVTKRYKDEEGKDRKETIITGAKAKDINNVVDVVIDKMKEGSRKRIIEDTDAYYRQLEEKILNGEATPEELLDFEHQTSRVEAEVDLANLDESMESLRPQIETAIRLKAVSREALDNLVSFRETIANWAGKMLANGKIDKAGHDQIVSVMARQLDREIRRLKSRDTRRVIRGFGDINYYDINTIDKINNLFYDKSQDILSKYSTFYKGKAVNYEDLTIKESNNPKLYEGLESKDNIPLLVYFAKRHLQATNRDRILKEKQGLADTEIYTPEYVAKFLSQAKEVIHNIDPERPAEEVARTAEDLWQDVRDITTVRYNINERMYQAGHKMGIAGFEKPIEEADPNKVFGMGYALRLEAMRQYEGKLRELSKGHGIKMVNKEFVDKPLDIRGIDVDLLDLLTTLKPELLEDNTFMSYNLSNFKDRMKSVQNGVLGTLEKVLKTSYTRRFPNDTKVAQHVIMGQLGKISGERALLNKYYGRDRVDEDGIDEIDKIGRNGLPKDIVPGTNVMIEYSDKYGDYHSAGGRILGIRNLRVQYVNDKAGKPRVEDKPFLFVYDRGNLTAIDMKGVNSIVAGDVYGYGVSSETIIDKEIRDSYNKVANELLDQIVDPLTLKSEYLKEDGRGVADAFLEDPNVDQRMRMADVEGATSKLIQTMKPLENDLNNTWGQKIKSLEDNITSMVVADTYLGLRYLGKGLLGAGMIGAGTATMNFPVMALGAKQLLTGGAGYFGRMYKLALQNAMGSAGWVARNPNSKNFIREGLKNVVKAVNIGMGMKGRAGVSSTEKSMGEINLAKMMGRKDNRANDMLDRAIFGVGENPKNAKLRDLMEQSRIAKKYKKDFEKLNKALDEYREKTKIEGSEENISQVVEQLAKKYFGDDVKVEFKKGIPFINGKALSHYDEQVITYMGVLNHILSHGMLLSDRSVSEQEVISHMNASENVSQSLRKYYEGLSQSTNAFAPTNDNFRNNLIQAIVEKSIGAYEKAGVQKQFIPNMLDKYSRFALKNKLDQTVHLKERNDIYNAYMYHISKDEGFQRFAKKIKEDASIPFNKYKVNDSRREFLFNTGIGLMMTAVKQLTKAGIAGIASYQMAQQVDDVEKWFGLSFVNAKILEMAGLVSSLFVSDDPKKNNELTDIVYGSSDVAGGFVGYGGTVPVSMLTDATTLLLYDYYNHGMTNKDRRSFLKEQDKYQDKSISRILQSAVPVPVVNTAIGEVPKIKEAINKDKRRR